MFLVAFWISSPTFFGERPKGPNFGAKAEAEPISPPTAFKITTSNKIIRNTFFTYQY